MKKCTLTQVPCRKAIMEVVEANKKEDRYSTPMSWQNSFKGLVLVMKHL